MHVIPHQGVGPLRFGMNAAEVARALGFGPKLREARGFGLGPREIFLSIFLTVDYDLLGKAAAFDFGGARETPIELVYGELRLLKTSSIEVYHWALKQDPDLESDGGFISRKLGLAMSAPLLNVDDDDDFENRQPAESFYIFRPGLYEEERELVARFNAQRSSKSS